MKNKILFDFKEDMIMIGIILVFSIICGIIMDVVAVKGGSSTDYFVSTLIVIGGFCALSFIGGMYFKRKFNIHISMSGKRSELIISELIVFTIECLILYLLSFLALLIEDRILLWLGVGTGLDGYTAVDSIFDSGAVILYFFGALLVRFYLGWASLKFNDIGCVVAILAPMYCVLFFSWLAERNATIERFLWKLEDFDNKLYQIWSLLPCIIWAAVMAVIIFIIVRSIKRQTVRFN